MNTPERWLPFPLSQNLKTGRELPPLFRPPHMLRYSAVGAPREIERSEPARRFFRSQIPRPCPRAAYDEIDVVQFLLEARLPRVGDVAGDTVLPASDSAFARLPHLEKGIRHRTRR